MVLPDSNGATTADTECVDGPRGDAETYLTVDVPAFVRAHYDTATDRRHWAVSGLSEGGTCALMLAVRHPNIFGTFADFSGDPAPTVGTVRATVEQLFGGSQSDYREHQPGRWFRIDAATGLEGWISAGTQESTTQRDQRSVVVAARDAGMLVTFDIVHGSGHNFSTFARSLRDAYPWIVWRISRNPNQGSPAMYHAVASHHRPRTHHT
jgi:S-formylglutathione hydrolase FrmB